MEFPFARDRDYPFAELRAFRSDLLKFRQINHQFSDDLRCNKLHWAKTYNEEIAPTAILADEKGFGERETFRLMPEGYPADIVLGLDTGNIPCQITVADPVWPSMNDRSGGGYVRSLQMELLRTDELTFGGKNTYKKDGVIISEPHARDVQEDYLACRLGLGQALARKQMHDGSGFALLIYARGHRFQLIDFDFSTFVAATVREIDPVSFKPLWVVDDGFLWELP
jgi:hypothetical protein